MGWLVVLLGFLVSCAGGDAVRLETLEPRSDAPTRGTFTLRFSDAVVADSAVGIVVDSTVVGFDPPLPARFRWTDARTLTVLPVAPLRPATKYTVTVNDTPLPGGRRLQAETERFTTEPLVLRSVNHRLQAVAGDQERVVLQVALGFSAAVTRDGVRAAVTLALDGIRGVPESLPWAVEEIDDTGDVLLRSDPFATPPDDGSATATLTIAASLLPRGGSLPLGETVTRELPLRPPEPIAVQSVRPSQQGHGYAVQIRLSDAPDATNVRDFVTLDPEREFTVHVNRNNIVLEADFQQDERVRVIVHEGLPGVNGSVTEREFSQQVTFPMLRPSLDFADEGTLLARHGPKNLALNIINVDTVRVEIARIHPNNLVQYIQNGGLDRWGLPLDRFGAVILDADLPVAAPTGGDLPIPATATVNLDAALAEFPTGLFRITVRHSDHYWVSASSTVLLSDVGLLAKQGEHTVDAWALDLSGHSPQPGLEVELRSRANQLLGRGVTDAGGHVRFTLPDDDREDMRAFALVASRGEEFAFLALDKSRISLGDWPVDGRFVPDEGIDAFVYGPRDTYRPGETIEIAAMLRPVEGRLPADFPVRLELRDPRGRLVAERRDHTGPGGLVTFAVDLPATARTGRYRAAVFSGDDREDGSMSLLVEEFLPDRMKVEVALDRDRVLPGETVHADVRGTMLFGPPAAGRAVDARVRLEPAPFAPESWPGYLFGDQRRADDMRTARGRGRHWAGIDNRLGDTTLDENGLARFSYTLPADLTPPAALTGRIEATVHETGGRSVTGRAGFTAHAYAHYLGIKPLGETTPKPGERASFQLVAVTPDERAVSGVEVTARLVRYVWQNSLMSGRGGRGYRSERIEETVDETTLTLGAVPVPVTFTPPGYGSYALIVEENGGKARSAFGFYVSGWGYGSWAMDEPDRLELVLDKDTLRVGETVRAGIHAPFPGTLLLTVERDDVIHHEMHRLDATTAEISLTASEDWEPNAYITALLLPDGDPGDPGTPRRAFGTVPLAIDPAPHDLTFTLDVPDQIEPNRDLTITVRAADAADGPFGLTVAAVDEGILQLTGFPTPSPLDYFFGKRALRVQSHENFSERLPNVDAADIHSTPGGGKALQLGHLSSLSQHRIEPVALWSGELTMSGGRATVTLPAPEYTGRLRVMAVGGATDRFGSAATDVIVRSALTVQPSLPRFTAGDDEFMVPVVVTSGLPRDADVRISIACDGPLTVVGDDRVTMPLPGDGEAVTRFTLRTEPAYELATVTITAEAAGESTTIETILPVRPAGQPLSRSGSLAVSAGSTAEVTLPDEFLPGSAQAFVHIMSAPVLTFGGTLDWLLRYPYGCLEQTVSRAFPLLYFDEVARRIDPDRFAESAPAYFVDEAIQRIVAMQEGSSGFAFWSRADRPTQNPWASVYAAHFLIEAAGRGHAVPGEVLRDTRAFLRRAADGEFDTRPDNGDGPRRIAWLEEGNRRVRAYALYTLARDGHPERGAMNRMHALGPDELAPDVRALLGGAFAEAGDWATAQELLPQTTFPAREDERDEAGTFDSATRTDAIVLTVLADHVPDHTLVPVLLQRLQGRFERPSYHYTTQDAAWALIAAGHLYARTEPADYTGRIAAADEPLATFTDAPFTLDDPDLAGETVTVSTEGSGTAFVFWEARGLPHTPDMKPASEGLEVLREFFDEDGALLLDDELEQGQLVVVRLEIRSTEGRWVRNVVIDDLLPAGLEVENPNLESREQVAWLPRSGRLQPEAMDIRDDRVLVFCDVSPRGTQSFYYAARAVTAGEFVHPPVRAEAMYDPATFGQSGGGALRVVAR